jgi:hypothetical protein
MDQDWLENGMFTFLKNVLESNKVNIPVVSGPQVRANANDAYGAYGISGNMAWNTTEKGISIELANGKKLIIPPYGWATLDTTKSVSAGAGGGSTEVSDIWKK